MTRLPPGYPLLVERSKIALPLPAQGLAVAPCFCMHAREFKV
jgi:hypothetical protein